MIERQHQTTEAVAIPTSQLATTGATGGDLLVEAMRSAGVDVAFGVISIHNLPLVEAVDTALRFVPVRHEAAAVNAADGYARASGRVGVAITSTGTGAGNAAGAMLEALTAQSRVLHITGNIDSSLLGEDRGVYHEVPRQLEMLRSVSDRALRIETARQVRAVLADALATLDRPPHGPVSIDWPIDLQYRADRHRQNQVRAAGRGPKAPARRQVAAAARAMAAARRPLIWAGGGARGVGEHLTRLAEAWGAGVLSGAAGRGAVPEDHPLVIGNFAQATAVEALIAEADCLLTVGSHLRANETKNFELPLPAQHVQIDLDPDAIGRNFPVTVGLEAEAAAVVAALGAELGEVSTEHDWPERIAGAARLARDDHRRDLGEYGAICDSMRRRLPRSSPIVRDVTVPGSSWGNRLLPIYEPTTNLFAAGGGIGQGLAMAIGASVARPAVPVLTIIGDGGLAVHLGELATLADVGGRVVVALFNDGGYGVLRNIQAAKGDPARGVDLVTPDMEGLAAAFGLRHARVTDAAGFDAALKRAIKKKRARPTIIEIDVASLSPAPTPLVPPVDVP